MRWTAMVENDVYAELVSRMNYPKSERLRSIFKKMVTLEEAKILLELPTPPDEIAKKLDLDRKTVYTRVGELFQHGLAVPTSKGYFLPRTIGQFHDTCLTDPGLTTELADLWQKFCEEEWFSDHAEELAQAETKGMKVIPMWKAIQTSGDILPEEDVRQIIQQAELAAMAPCPCRRRGRQCDGPIDVCLQLDRAAEYVIRRGTGREVFKEEAIEILGDAEDRGLMHTAPPFAVICSCCSCCCNILRPLVKYGKLSQGLAKTSYRAVVNQELCDGCQLCIDQCRFEAIDMKQYPAYKRGKAFVDAEKCFGCGACVVKCPVEGALRLELANMVTAL